jgi:hypothetical protein
MKKLGRVTIPRDMFAEARELAAREYETVAQVVRRPLQKEINRMHRKRSSTLSRNYVG